MAFFCVSQCVGAIKMKLLHLRMYVYWGEYKEPLFSLYTNTQLNWRRYICTGADVTNDGTEHKGN